MVLTIVVLMAGYRRQPLTREARTVRAELVAVIAGEHPGQSDQAAHGVGVLDHIEPEDAGLPRIGQQDRRQDADGRRLASPVGPEQAEHGARRNREVDAVESIDVAEVLDEPFSPDGVLHAHHARVID